MSDGGKNRSHLSFIIEEIICNFPFVICHRRNLFNPFSSNDKLQMTNGKLQMIFLYGIATDDAVFDSVRYPDPKDEAAQAFRCHV
jgi:hypothetical protein